MEYVTLGSSSLQISRIGFGAMGIGDRSWRSWVITGDEAKALVKRAHELGINFFDTCNFYSKGVSEELLGSIVRELGIRNEIIIATKCGAPMYPGPNGRGYSRKQIVTAVEGSLRRLGVEVIDLYQTHLWAPETHLEEMVMAFDHLVRQGKVLYVGATDIPCWQLARAVYLAKRAGLTAFASLQHHYNAIWREDERDLIPFCRAEGLGLLTYSPVARGFLAGRQRRLDRTTERARTDDYAWVLYGRNEDAKAAERIEDIAEKLGIQPAQLSLAWVLSRQPGAAPIVGPTRIEQLEAAVAALALDIPEEILKEIDATYVPRPRGGHS